MLPGVIPNIPVAGDKTISAAFLQEIAKEVAALLRVDGDGVGVSWDGGSLQLFDVAAQLNVFIAKINGSVGDTYGWIEQRPASVAKGFEDRPNGRTGTPSIDPAKELNNATGIANDKLVVMFPGWHSTGGSGSSTRIDRGWRFIGGASSAPPFTFGWAAFLPVPTPQCIFEFLAPGKYQFNFSIWARATGGWRVLGAFDEYLVPTNPPLEVYGPFPFSNYGSPPSQLTLARPIAGDPDYSWTHTHWTFLVNGTMRSEPFAVRFATGAPAGTGATWLIGMGPDLVSSGTYLRLI